ncbi:MAG TPA: hypothetical protein VFS21_14640 [Roseiflexaceae bacterium]|nr:hypothetical protein [Roseiflexaceae bacterium]
MSNVRSEALRTRHRPPSGEEVAQGLGRIGLWLAILAFGAPFFAINGGFSIRGLGQVCAAFNDEGRMIWAVLSLWQFRLPATLPGLPASQPVILWLGVVAASILQGASLWLKLSGKRVPVEMLVATIVLSVYDFVTTFIGAGTVAWIVQAGLLAQTIIALLLTFGLEVTIGALLPRQRDR